MCSSEAALGRPENTNISFQYLSQQPHYTGQAAKQLSGQLFARNQLEELAVVVVVVVVIILPVELQQMSAGITVSHYLRQETSLVSLSPLSLYLTQSVGFTEENII